MARTKDAEQTETEEQAALRAMVEAEVPEDREADATLAVAIEAANVRLARKAEVQAEVQNSRQLTTLLIESGIGSREQVLWVKTYLPRKKRKNGDSEDE